MAEAIAFYTLSLLILGLGVAVITTSQTVHSVVFLVLNFLCVAVLYVVLRAEFLAVIQILVYAGGIVVLYLFVVMLEILTTGPSLVQKDGLILTFYPILKKWKLGMVTLMMNQKNTVVFQAPFISLEETRQTHYTKLL